MVTTVINRLQLSCNPLVTIRIDMLYNKKNLMPYKNLLHFAGVLDCTVKGTVKLLGSNFS